MCSRSFIPFLIALALLSAILACNAPGWNEVKETFDLPTPAPSPAPSPATSEASEGGVNIMIETPATPTSPYPLAFQGVGMKTSFASSEEASCLRRSL